MIQQISVVMPMYNSARFLREAIDSVLKQTYQAFELIIVDDGSTDSSLQIARDYAQKDGRVRVVAAEHGGISRTLNRGISCANGEWIAIMEADDVSLPTRLQKQTEAASQNPRVVGWGSSCYHINHEGKVLGLKRASPRTEEEFHRLRRTGTVFVINHPTAFLRKETVLRAGGYDSRFDEAQDLELFDRMARFGSLLALAEPLLLYRIHTVSRARVFRQTFITRYVKARARAHLAGEPEPSLELFTAEYRNQPLAVRVHRYMDDLSILYYRQSGLCIGNREYVKGLYTFAVCALLNPAYLGHLWNQHFSLSARRWLQAR
jgi:glycosyltransferase involved in cell wall biosynthesis